MCAFKLRNPGLPAELWDAFDPDDDSDGPVEDEHHAIFDCPGYMYAREQFQDLFQSHITTVSQFLNQPQQHQASQVPHMDQGMPHKQKPSLMGLCQAPNRLFMKSIGPTCTFPT